MSRVNTRSKFRPLLGIRSARSSIESLLARCSAIQICSSRIEFISVILDERATQTLPAGLNEYVSRITLETLNFRPTMLRQRHAKEVLERSHRSDRVLRSVPMSY